MLDIKAGAAKFKADRAARLRRRSLESAIAGQLDNASSESAPPARQMAATPQKAAMPQKADQSALTIEKLTQDLQKAGFSEVKVLEDAFLVQAKT
jgi:hypothetical protein